MSDGGSRGPLTTVLFNPALLSKEDLIRGFVARRDLLERLLDDLRRVQSGSPPQHQMVIGQRGLGKTTLLRRLAFAIEDDPQLAAAWLPLVFPEEQYNVKSLSDFWLNCADALSDALDRLGDKAGADALDDRVEEVPTDPERRSAAALALLIEETERLKRGLVLLVDNLDIVLDRLDHQEEWEFRRVISAEPRLYFVGASSRALEAVYEHGRAFFDYFQVQELRGLSDADMFSVLGRLADEGKDEQVARLIREKPERVRALRVLTGGNPRTLVLLYRVFEEGPDGDVQRDIEQLLDLYTPLYKARFEDMAAQSQQVVDAMAIHWDPVTAAELAEKLKPLSVSQVSAQLSRLESLGVVEKTPWFEEKKAAFQISERFFNIWYLMRASRRVRRRLIWLVKFLEAWFERDEIRERARRHLEREPAAVGAARYAEMALAYSQTVDDPYLQRGLESAGLRAALDVSLGGQFDFSDLPPELQDRKARMERLRDLRTRVLAMRFEGVDAKELWRLLGGSPQLLLEEKAKVVEDLPALGAAAARELLAKLQRAERGSKDAYQESINAVAKLYEALADGDITDIYDVAGLLAVASRCKCPGLPTIAIGSRSNPTFGPRTLSEEELRTAESAWRALAEAPRQRASAWNGLGILLKDRFERFEEAEEAFRKAIELDAKYAAPWNNLGNLLQHRLARYAEAEEAYRKALQFNPRSQYAWNNLGDLMQYRLGRYQEAEEDYRRAIALSTQYPGPWEGLGNLLQYRLQRYGEAEDAYRKAIEIDPEFAIPWNDLGNLLMERLGRYGEAEQAYRKAIEIDSKYAFPWNNLGNLLKDRLRRPEEAEKAYRKAIEIDPRYAQPWNGLGNLLKDRLRRPEEAEQAYRRAIEIDPRFAGAWNGLGNLLKDLRRREEAEAAYRKSIEINPQYAFPWNNLGTLLEQDLGRNEDAEQAYRKAVEIDPQYATAWNNLGGLLKDRLGKYADAEQAYRKAIEIDARDAAPWNGLGNLFRDRLGRLAEAEQAYRHAIQLDPQYAYAWGNLGRLLEADGDRQGEALAAYLRAAELDPTNGWRRAQALRVAKTLADRKATLEGLSLLHEVAPDSETAFVLAGALALGGEWERASELLKALAGGDTGQPDIWAFGAVVKSGHLEDAIALLEAGGASERWRPLYEALRAVRAGSKDYLRRVAPEVRGVAEAIVDEIAPELSGSRTDSRGPRSAKAGRRSG